MNYKMRQLCLRQIIHWRGLSAAIGVATWLAGCAGYSAAPIPISQNHIQAEPQALSKDAGIPAPVKMGNFVPVPKPAVKPQTYSVVVNEVPVKELLFALARDSKLNVDIHPAIQGLVTMNAVNEPLDAILDRLSQQVNLRYKVEGNTLSITPDSPYMKTYRVDYVNLSRNTSSNIGVSSQIAGVGTSSAGGAATTGTSGSGVGGNNSSTAVKSASDNNFWDVMAENLRHILSATRSVASSAEDKAARAEIVRSEREDRLRQAEAVARAGAGAPALFSNVFGNEKPISALGDIKEQVIVNPVVGTVSVLGTDRQHKLVKEYLASVASSSQRQVLIEATIVEVGLKDQFHAGVDWTSIGRTTGFNIKTVANAKDNLAGTLASFFSIGYSNANNNLTATLNLLESFGTTRILSSPKIMAINNQTALLKVVNNEVYFSIEVQQGAISTTGIITQPVYTTTAHTVPVGVVMSVTPQISENGVVSMTVRPTISRIAGFKEDPNPALVQFGKDSSTPVITKNQVPVVQVREMESVLQVNSGQTIVMGGLMQDDIARGRDGLPILSRPDGWGAIFGQQERKATQTELVIFLRPTVITNPSLDSEELSAFRRFLPDPKAAAQP